MNERDRCSCFLDSRTSPPPEGKGWIPRWWKDAVDEFEQYYQRPYRPPRLGDGSDKHEVINRIETKYNVELTFICFDPEPNGSWNVLLDGTPICEVEHRRHRTGYSIFEISERELEAWIWNHLETD